MKIFALVTIVLGLISSAQAGQGPEEKVLDCTLYASADYSEFRIGDFTELAVNRDSSGTLSARAIAPTHSKTVELGQGEITVKSSGEVFLSFDGGATTFTLGYNPDNYRYEGEGSIEKDFAASISCVVFSEF